MMITVMILDMVEPLQELIFLKNYIYKIKKHKKYIQLQLMIQKYFIYTIQCKIK